MLNLFYDYFMLFLGKPRGDIKQRFRKAFPKTPIFGAILSEFDSLN